MLWDLSGNFADNPATQFEDTFVVNLVENHFITEWRPLKSVAREKWGTHDALRAQ